MEMNQVNNPISSSWTDNIPDDQWEIYRQVLEELRALGLPYALGGAFGVATYTGFWRNTKDLDIYTLPENRDAMILVLGKIGLRDYYEVLPYVREWIYRSYTDDIIVDIIWAMANQRVRVDKAWVMRGPEIEVRGEPFRVLPVEELIWAKTYVLQKDRSDWPDVLNLLYAMADQMDWDHLVKRFGDDLPLLKGLLDVFAWLSPNRLRDLPDDVFQMMQIGRPQPEQPEVLRRRANLLDTRDWYIPLLKGEI